MINVQANLPYPFNVLWRIVNEERFGRILLLRITDIRGNSLTRQMLLVNNGQIYTFALRSVLNGNVARHGPIAQLVRALDS
jgi:hypothetical protein